MTNSQPAHVRRSKAGRFAPRAGSRPQTRTLPSETVAERRVVAPGWRQRLSYAFDSALSRRPHVVLWWLTAATLAIVLFAALCLTIWGITGVDGQQDPLGFLEALWQSLLRILDTGTVAGDLEWPARLVGIILTVAGIFLAGTLIGLIANLIDQKLAELRRGHSLVLERDHVLILGWSPRVPTMVIQLIEANRSRRNPAIVIVADEDKTAMEDTLRRIVGDTANTKIVCRTAEPWSDQALDMGNIDSARSVIVAAARSDATAVKSLLAINARHAVTCPVVVETLEPSTARSIEHILGANVIPVCSEDVVAELTAQACREPGIGLVFKEFLNFEGSEIYVQEFPSLAGRTFAHACLAFGSCSVMGIVSDEGVTLNPPGERVLAPGDRLIAVAEDDSSFLPSPVSGQLLPPGSDLTHQVVSGELAIIGWSHVGPSVITGMDRVAQPGTRITVHVDPETGSAASVRIPDTTNCTVVVEELGGTPDVLAQHVIDSDPSHVILLGYRDFLDPDEADARSLLTVLAIRQAKSEKARTVIELLDQRHVPLAEATGVDDFVVSDELTSQMMTQLSEQPELADVFLELFRREGVSVQLRAPTDLRLTESSTFADVVVTGLAHGLTPLGLVHPAQGRVELNPDKTVPLRLSPDSRFVVLAGGL